MKASEAREITNKSYTIWPEIFRQIKEEAEKGNNSTDVYGLSTDEVHNLKALGYTVVDRYDAYIYKVSW